MRLNSTRVFLFLMAFGIPSCADLELTSRGFCGNHIVEQGEYCDGPGSQGGTCNESCFWVCKNDSSHCPEGYRCGKDGICRRPSGIFDSIGLFDLPITQVAVADMDASGKLALVATRDVTTSIAYLDELGLAIVSPSITAIPAIPKDRPTLGDINGDGATDLVQTDASAIRVTISGNDRKLATKSFPHPIDLSNLQRIAVGNFRHAIPGHDLIGVDSVGIGTSGEVNAPDLGMVPVPLYFYQWPTGQSVKQESIVLADLVDDPNLPSGDEMALALDGDNRVLVLEPLALDMGKVRWNQNATLQPPTEIVLPAGATVTGPILARRLGSDPTKPLDLLIFGKNTNGDARVFVAFNAGNRSFYAVPTFAGPAGVAGILDTQIPIVTSALDAAHLNDDGVIDFILEGGTIMSVCNSPQMACDLEVDPAAPTSRVTASYELRQLNTPAKTAVHILPNASGRNSDYVSMTQNAVVVHRNTGNGLFNDFELYMSTRPQHLTVEDLDGDGMQDLIFTQDAYALCRNSDDASGQTVFISYRNELGVPKEPVPIADLHDIRQIVAGQIYRSSAMAPPDGVADLLVWTSEPNQSAAEGMCSEALPDAPYTFPGNSLRQLNAPINLAKACSDTPQSSWLPKRVTVGKFDAEAGADLAIFAKKLMMTGGAAEPMLLLAANVNQGVDVCTETNVPTALSLMPDEPEPTLAALDIDGDDRDEVLLGSVSKDSYAIGRVIENGGVKTWQVETSTTGWEYTRVFPAQLTHYGGDDLVFVRGQTTDSETLPSETMPPEIIIKWSSKNAPAPGDGSSTRIVVNPNSCPRSGSKAKLIAVVPIDIDADPEQELLLLVDKALQIVDLSSTSPPEIVREVCLPAWWDAQNPSIAAGDVDGDGIDDIVLASLAGTEIYRGQVEQP